MGNVYAEITVRNAVLTKNTGGHGEASAGKAPVIRPAPKRLADLQARSPSTWLRVASESVHKTPSELINEIIREKIAIAL